ncbi:MAG TPA: SIS domain-containing protein [Nocardioides sp.]|jgi:fructoselysine-6-P-deglycase FrlB-like protein|nr:SIS domain-containing protein [Nocardioides sp.]
MDPALFLADLEEKPARLGDLAAALRAGNDWGISAADAERSWLLLGMGSSGYAAQVAAARLRARGVRAVAENAATDLLPRLDAGATVVAITASGGSAETLDACRRLRSQGRAARFVAMTNVVDSPVVDLCDDVVPMWAGHEAGGVACRTYQHTVAQVLALEASLGGGLDVPSLLDRAAEACAHLLAGRGDWLPALSDALLGPDGTHVVAPAHRLGSALQSALMLREGPRLPAYGCETADWSHVDVYLTKTTDYRMLLLAGSRWEDELLTWVRERGSTLVAVGGDVPGAALTLRYPHDDVDDVRLLTETLVAELLAAHAWTLSRAF